MLRTSKILPSDRLDPKPRRRLGKKFLNLSTVAASVLLCVACSSEPRQLGAPGHTVVRTAESGDPDQNGEIKIQVPDSYFEQPGLSYPVLYVAEDRGLDLEEPHAALAELVEQGEVPEMILVAFDGRRRFLPATVESPRNGGAQELLKYVEKELIPFVNDHYRASSFRVLAGFSHGTLFATYALTENPDLFDGVLMQSLTFENEFADFGVERFETLFAENPDITSVLFFNLGDQDTKRNRVEGFRRLEGVLEDRAPESFRWRGALLPGVGHGGTRASGYRDGLRYIFGEK